MVTITSTRLGLQLHCAGDGVLGYLYARLVTTPESSKSSINADLAQVRGSNSQSGDRKTMGLVGGGSRLRDEIVQSAVDEALVWGSGEYFQIACVCH